ncbi:Di-copper centre-containing protein [Delitschia confertaspora ATCC 74209]|uniref:Di-copper centre-containing protein n=1 Tax=Delitschia confertaspora ATCC 74209 TaxID=1513339 RepID=A0A9P4JGI5_9PLEO|nr:Di-copper centre-containing protein [Delitschia confertaspora ATCC 74209]
MRLNSQAALLLLAGTLTSALPVEDTPVFTTTAAGGATTTLPAVASRNTAVAQSQIEQLANFAQELANTTLTEAQEKMKRSSSCNIFNVRVRREWGTLSSNERREYIKAVKCVMAKDAKTPRALIPGARSRYDDWVGSHINQTNFIHYTGTFLGWHRYYVWQYEQMLRNECGYTGSQPYWDWAKTAATGLEKSPIFDGSNTSMSGNGLPIKNQPDIVLGGNGLPPIFLPAGTGGGNVTTGPFKNMIVNLGPVALSAPGGETISNGDGLAYNPRVLKRDLTDAINRRYSNATSIVNLLLNSKDIETFQMAMQGVPGSGDIGVHGGGHYSLGGDPGRDVFTSPADPVFYLHHAQIDRVWWIWQALKPWERYSEKGISGTGTFLNSPPSPDTTLKTLIDLGYATAEGAPGALLMEDLMSTLAGPFCYIYV